VLADEADPVEAILGEAHGRNAGLIVVGARPRSRDPIKPSCVPVRVIDRARFSILIVPLDDEEHRRSSLLSASSRPVPGGGTAGAHAPAAARPDHLFQRYLVVTDARVGIR